MPAKCSSALSVDSEFGEPTPMWAAGFTTWTLLQCLCHTRLRNYLLMDWIELAIILV